MENKANVLFKGSVPSGQKLVKRYSLRKPGTIERIRNRLYSGSVGTFKVYVWLVYGEAYESVLKFADKLAPYLNGDDDRDEYDVTVPFKPGSYIEVWAVNEGDYSYDLNLTLEVDYYGGMRRVI